DPGVTAIGVLGAQPVHEQPDVALELHRAADRVEARLLAQRAQEAREWFAERRVAEVGETRASLRLREQRLELACRLRHRACSTPSTSWRSSSGRASRSSASGSASNGTGGSSGTRSAPRARCASSWSWAARLVSRP